MEFIDNRTIKIDKELNELDKFVLEFVDVLQKHAKYVIISGYVSILFGRSRATEDIDIFIDELTKEGFLALYSDLEKNGWWCVNIEGGKGTFEYLNDNVGVRFAKRGEAIPNIEIKFARKKFDKDSMNDTISVLIGKDKMIISTIEQQIAYKKIALGDEKDMEDAKHLEEVFKDFLDKEKLRKMEALIRSGNYDF